MGGGGGGTAINAFTVVVVTDGRGVSRVCVGGSGGNRLVVANLQGGLRVGVVGGNDVVVLSRDVL